MENIDEIFLLALKEFADKAKSHRQFALNTLGIITPDFLSKTFKGKKSPSDELKRRIAAKLGYPGSRYEDFLNIGRAILAGRPIPEPPCEYVPDEDLADRGFISVPFSADMKLSAGGGGTVPYTDDERSSPVVIHGPTLKRRNARGLQAFLVGGDSMEPIIASGGLVVTDTTQNDLRQLKDGALYVLCWDLHDGECAVKYLRWAEKGRLLSIESANPFYKPVFRSVEDVVLVGKVIWSCREHKY